MKTENRKLDKVGVVREAQFKAIWELFMDVCSESGDSDLVWLTIFDDMSGSINDPDGNTIVEFAVAGNYKLGVTWLDGV